MPSNPIHALLVSASLGALIGLVRQWSYEREHRGETAKAGLRTFTAWGMLGAGAGLLEQAGVTWAFAAILIAFTIILVGVYIGEGKRHVLGLTTLSVGLVTFLVGAMAAYELYIPATMAGVGVMLILGIKHWSHSWTRRWKEEDLRCLLQFAAITGIILPLAPNQDFGGFNPYRIWLMVVLVASLGFLGYVAIRWLGANAGLMIIGLAGGLASSTATTLAMSRESRKISELSDSLALAVVLACTVMLARVAVVLTFVAPTVTMALLPIFGMMAIPGIIWGVWQWRTHRQARQEKVHTPAIANPLSLSLAIKFGLIYAVVRFLVKLAAGNINPGWVYGVSFISGLTDMDAIALSTAQSARDGTLPVNVAVNCIVIAALSNTLVKAGLAVALGAPQFRRTIALALGAVFIAGAAGLWLF